MKTFGHDRLELVEELLGLMARDKHSAEVRTAAKTFLLFSSQCCGMDQHLHMNIFKTKNSEETVTL